MTGSRNSTIITKQKETKQRESIHIHMYIKLFQINSTWKIFEERSKNKKFKNINGDIQFYFILK